MYNKLVYYTLLIMPHVSRNKLPKDIEEQLLNNFDLVLSSISNKDRMIKFLSFLLTETERVMLAKRLAVVILVSEGKADSEISNSLHITRMTIGKIRYFYEARAKVGFDVALAELKSERLKTEVKKFIGSLTRYAVRAAGGRI